MELSSEKATHELYMEQVDNYQTQLEESEEELKVLLVRKENSRVAEDLQRKKVRHKQHKTSF